MEVTLRGRRGKVTQRKGREKEKLGREGKEERTEAPLRPLPPR